MFRSITKIGKISQSLTGYKFCTSVDSTKPMRVAVTGAGGQIGYALLFRIASGQLFGPNQPVILHLVDIPQSKKILDGVAMELLDCAFPLLDDIVCTDDLKVGFGNVNAAILVGAKPRSKGMQRGDLLQQNAKIFIPQGKALSDYANPDVKVLVVGNPANTNCLIAATHAKNLKKQQFTAMTQLDLNRAKGLIAQKAKTSVRSIANVIIWGNHSPTMFPDITYAKINGLPVGDVVGQSWYEKQLIPRVQKRGAEIIQKRGLSSAASAAHAALVHMRDWVKGGNGNDWNSFGFWSNGNPYNIPEGIYYSFPIATESGASKIVNVGHLTDFQKNRMNKSADQLVQERKAIQSLLKV